jgi:hypothetical protein
MIYIKYKSLILAGNLLWILKSKCVIIATFLSIKALVLTQLRPADTSKIIYTTTLIKQ